MKNGETSPLAMSNPAGHGQLLWHNPLSPKGTTLKFCPCDALLQQKKAPGSGSPSLLNQTPRDLKVLSLMPECKKSSSAVLTSYSLNSWCLENIPADALIRVLSTHCPEQVHQGMKIILQLIHYTQEWLTQLELRIIFFGHFSLIFFEHFSHSCHYCSLSSLNLH